MTVERLVAEFVNTCIDQICFIDNRHPDEISDVDRARVALIKKFHDEFLAAGNLEKDGSA